MPINFDHVYFQYGKKGPFVTEALNDINIDIAEGSFTCLVGKTGCGKSTLIQQLNGLLIPTKGAVNVRGFVVSKDKKTRTKKLQPLRKEVGVVFQFSEYQLFNNTVEDDVAFGPMNFGVKKEDAIIIAHKMLNLVGLNESYYKRSPFELSGGEKRRVAIAGIMAMEPKVLVLDEPTVGLDPRGSKEILSLFKTLNEQGTTIIFVTHDMNIVYEYASDVIVMDDSHVVLHCKPSDLFDHDVSQYSLEIPLIQKLIHECKFNGLQIDVTNIRNLDDFVNEIVRIKGGAK